MPEERLKRQLEFVLEIDRLKAVVRQSHLIGADRRENSAEHCWHVAVMAFVLSEHANEPIDAARCAKMLLVHDIVEIDAGDVYRYDVEARAERTDREERAAERIYGLLPDEQPGELRRLWQEFEHGDSPEARFARALDRLMPLLHNYHTEGRSWKEHGVSSREVLQSNEVMAEGSEGLWEYARSLIKDAVRRGYLEE